MSLTKAKAEDAARLSSNRSASPPRRPPLRVRGFRWSFFFNALAMDVGFVLFVSLLGVEQLVVLVGRLRCADGTQAFADLVRR